MCESHINDVIRENFKVKKVTSSRRKNEVTILSQDPLDEKALRRAVAATGYKVLSVSSEPYEKRGLFSR